MSTDTNNLGLAGPLVSGSTTDLASVVEMFDSLLERSRVGAATTATATLTTSEDAASDCEHSSQDTPDTPSTPDNSPDTPADDGTPALTSALAPMRRLQIVEERDDAERKSRYTKRRLTEQRPLSVSSTSSSSSSACSSLPRGRPAWRIQPGTEAVEQGGKQWSRGDGIRKSTSSGSGDSGLSSPLAFVSSPTSPGARLCDPNLTYIDRVVTEVIETEAIYVNDLRQIIEGYLFYWRENPEPAIVDEHTDALFGNVQEIYRCNSVFLSALELCGLDASKVAQSFVNHGGRFAVYIDYCTKYPRTVSVLTELMRRETTARLFRERQAALGHALPLGSFLLKPVQRILKYHLLLQNMKSHTDTRTEGYAAVCAALETMTALAAHINDMKRRHEHAVRVQEIQSLLYGWEGQDLTTYGELVAEGAFRMHRAKASRHVFLFDRMVLITKRREDSTLTYKAHIMCSNLMLIESIPGDPYSFHVVPFDNPRLQYTLQARSMEQKRDWTLQLKRAILESYNAVIPFHARELVMQLGQDKSAEVGDTLRRNSSSRRQHSAPEYLERRRAYKRANSFNQKLRLRSRDRARENSADGEEERERKSSTHSCPGDEKKARRGLLTLRRKSEPFLSLLPSPRGGQGTPGGDGGDSPSSDLHCLPDLDEEEPATDELDATDLDDSRSLLDGADVTDVDDVSECDVISDVLELNGKPENLQTIVEQLVMQNMEFRRILNKPRRGLRRQNSATKSEETDTDNDVDEDDLSFGACPEEVTPTGDGEPSALAFHSHDNTEYVSFMDYGKHESVLSPRFEIPSLTEESDGRLTLQRTVSDPCRKVARKLGRMQHVGHNELLHFLGSIRRKSQRVTKAEQERISLASSAEADASSVRRAQSFTDQDDTRPSTLSLASAALRRVASSASDPVAARASAVYLTPQLAKRADSLPRGAFQRTGSLGRSVDFDAARFLAPHAQEEDDRLTTYTTTPAASSESLDVHPDYKIYGPAVSQSSLRSMVGSFRARLTRLKAPAIRSGVSSVSGSGNTSLNSLFGSPAGSQVDMRDQSRSRLLYIMAKSLRERVASLVPDEESDAESPRSTSSAFPHGSASLGARLARPPRETPTSPQMERPRSPLPAGKTAESASTTSSCSGGSSELGSAGSNSSNHGDRPKTNEARPDSMLSSSSVVTSCSVASSGGDSTSGVATEASVTSSCEEPAAVRVEREESQSTSDGEGSVGSFYEHELDILEDIHGSELFRDSAIYSDPDELIDSIEATMPSPNSTSALPSSTTPASGSSTVSKKVPPPVAAKPAKSVSIRDRLRCLEECSQVRRDDAAGMATLSAETLKSISERRRELELQRWEDSGSPQTSTEAVKSISERRRELEQWRCGGRGGDESETSSQHSTSTINTVVEATSRGHSRSSSQEEETLPRGWVKQVIGKLQGESSA